MSKLSVKFSNIFIYTCITVLISSPLLQAETALYIPEIQEMMTPYNNQQVILLDFKLIDHQCRERIKKAVIKVQQSKNRNEHRYFQMEYIEQRADHVKAVVLHTIKLIKFQDNFLKKIQMDLNRHKAFTRSTQVNGMKNLMQMVIFIDSETVLIRNEKNKDRCLFLISSLHKDIQTYTLATFLAPPSTSGPEFKNQIKNIRNRLYENLKNLRIEFVYLDEKLQQIDTEGKHES